MMFHPDGPTFAELMRQALSSTQRGYDLLAPKFDRTPFRTPDWLLALVGERIEKGPAVERALDVCCGTGAGMRMLRPLASRDVTGIDFSEGMLAEARRGLATAPGAAAVRLVHGDALAMPFDRAFDVATCFGALGHIPAADEERFIAEVHRALKPGGRFVFVTSTLPPVLSMRWVLSRGFNAVMRVRNAFWRPKFIMYYLTFLLPEVQRKLERAGFDVEIHSGLPSRVVDETGAIASQLRIVVATRR